MYLMLQPLILRLETRHRRPFLRREFLGMSCTVFTFKITAEVRGKVHHWPSLLICRSKYVDTLATSEDISHGELLGYLSRIGKVIRFIDHVLPPDSHLLQAKPGLCWLSPRTALRKANSFLINSLWRPNYHIRPYLPENTGSRLLSPS